jgi:UDP-GlcNAc:undecaprenyl-phosphate GlcNAc-1-phosphate transferase
VKAVLLSALAAVVTSLVLTLAAERVAARLGIVARPRADRWHRQPVPLLGGVAIALGTVAGLGVADAWGRRIFVLVAGAALMMAVGLLDDVRCLRPQTKLLAQVLLAGGLLLFGFELRLTGYRLLDTLLTLFWVVGVTNAFNLLDNMDGLAATIALVAGAFRAYFFLQEGDLTGATTCAAFFGSVGGFLVRNFPPAKIFMGDAGSLFLGFFLAGVSISDPGAAYSRGLAAVLVIPVLLLLVPLFDTAFVTVTRLVAGRSPAMGGRDHTSHRLVAVGLSERRVVVLLAFFATAAGAIAVLSYRVGLSYTVVLLALVLLAMVLLAIHLGRVQVATSAPPRRPGAVLALIADFPYKRQVATVLLDAALIPTAYYAAYVLRFEQNLSDRLDAFTASAPVVLVVQLSTLTAFGLYRGIWRFTSLEDLWRIGQAVALGTLSAVFVLTHVQGFKGYSQTVFILHGVLLFVFIGTARASFRLLRYLLWEEPAGFLRVLIYGAGAGGELLLRELWSNLDLKRTPVGFVDDDRAKAATRIHGLPVLGGGEDLERLVREYRIDEVIISSAKIGASTLEAAREVCARKGIPLRRAVLRLEAA